MGKCRSPTQTLHEHHRLETMVIVDLQNRTFFWISISLVWVKNYYQSQFFFISQALFDMVYLGTHSHSCANGVLKGLTGFL